MTEHRALFTDLRGNNERIATRERQQAVVARLGMHALAENDLYLLFDQAVREIQTALDVDYCEVLELESFGDELLLTGGAGWRKALIGNAAIGTGLSTSAGYTLSSGRPVILEMAPLSL